MTIPVISIKRHAGNIHEWALLIGDDAIALDAGESSIADCIKSAIGPLPLNILRVQIRYCGIYTGTFNVEELAERPDLAADQVGEVYAAAMQKL